MKLCTFEIQTQVGRFQRVGAVTSRGIADLNFAAESKLAAEGDAQPAALARSLVPSSMLDFLDAGERAMEAACHALAFLAETGMTVGPDGQTLVYQPEEVKLLTPLPNPRSLRDFYAFEAHVKRGFEKRGEAMPKEWYEMPVYYKGGHHNIVGTDTEVPWPSFTEKLDYELELAAVIGKRGRDIREEERASRW
jgi:2-keto-4-pentenoate hydratase/2-oxohepta-3-ene-1,7-dioic acid hydratase in catechol pathway